MDSLKKELKSKKEDTLHAQRMEEDKRLMRQDLNRILEERSVAKQSAQERLRRTIKRSDLKKKKKKTYGHMSRKKTKKTYSSTTSSRSIRRTK